MRIIFLHLLILSSTLQVNAQTINRADFSNYEMRFNANNDWNRSYDGSPYLQKEWHRTKVVIASDTLTYNNGRYNLVDNFLEVMHKGEHKYIKPKYISSFQHKGNASVPNSVYLINSEFAFEKEDNKGITQISTIGEIKVITAYQASIRKRSKEIPQLSGTGDKDRIIVKKKNFLLINSDLHYIKKTKDIAKHLDINYKTIKQIIKDKNIDVSSHEGLISLLSVLN